MKCLNLLKNDVNLSDISLDVWMKEMKGPVKVEITRPASVSIITNNSTPFPNRSENLI